MLVGTLVGLAIAAASAWALMDASRRPERWARLFQERPAARAMAWIALLSGAALVGVALAGAGGETLLGIGALAVIALAIAFKLWSLAQLNRALDDLFRR